MEGFVLIIVAIGIVTERRRLAFFMGRQDGVAIGLAMATGCKIAGHPFDFGHDLKNFKHSFGAKLGDDCRSEENTSELQSLMRISYAVFCLQKTNKKITIIQQTTQHLTY